MNCYLGIDGGGTKTAYLLIDDTGQELSRLETEGISYREYGVDTVISKIMHSNQICLNLAKKDMKDLKGVVIGLPCYGESKDEDALILQKFILAFGDIPFYLTNDVEVGWAGSLDMQPGINVVAGTGSIAFGKNLENKAARSGGWSTFFGDEGSCYWLGRKTMELFSKQADYRSERSILYSLIMEHFKLQDAINFIDIMEKEYVTSRSKVASMQKILLQAAAAGDKSAIELYKRAAFELFLLIESVAKQLELIDHDFMVSYSGGLFHAKEFVLPYLECLIETIGGRLVIPTFTPVQGAALLAIHMFSDQRRDNMINLFKKNNK